MTTIELYGLELYAYHGALEWERARGQRFLVDLWLEPAGDRGAATDAVEDVVDYREAVAVLREVSGQRAFHVLEAFAAALADALLARLALDAVRVRVRKPDVRLALPVEHAAVVVERQRTESR